MSGNADLMCYDQNRACEARCWKLYNQCQNQCIGPGWWERDWHGCLNDCDSLLQTCIDSCKDEYAACEARAKEPTAPKRFTEQQRTDLAHVSAVAYGVAGLIAVVGIVGVAMAPAVPLMTAGGELILAGGEVATQLPAWATTFGTIMGTEAGIDTILGAISGYMSVDPVDLNFTTLAQPTMPTPLSITSGAGTTLNQPMARLVESLNALLENQAGVVAYLHALYASINRSQGAATANNSTAESQQLTAARSYAQALAALLDHAPSLRLSVASQLESNKVTFTLSEDDMRKGRRQILSSGIPSEMQNILRHYGINGQEKDVAVRRLTRELFDMNVPVQFPGILTSPERASIDNGMTTILRQFAVASP